jgi:hypothetical protein
VRLWAGADLRTPEDERSRRLAGAIERAVYAGDLAASYESRWREEAKRGESPFQLKRVRMEAATIRFSATLDTVVDHATAWLDDVHEPEPWLRQRARSIENLVDHLAARPRDGVLSDLACLDATIDALENALANLCAQRSGVFDAHPFR